MRLNAITLECLRKCDIPAQHWSQTVCKQLFQFLNLDSLITAFYFVRASEDIKLTGTDGDIMVLLITNGEKNTEKIARKNACKRPVQEVSEIET